MTTKKETVMNIALEKLVPFRDHPFQVRDDEQMQMITESIRSVGVLVPAIARPLEDGSFELISGHRRKHACEVAGLSTLPVIVRDVDQDTATVMMVDSNFQREEILPSEFAESYAQRESLTEGGDRTWRWIDAIKRLFYMPFGWVADGSAPYIYVHNTWLDIARDAGLFPFLFFLLPTIQSIKTGRRLVKIRDNNLCLCLIILYACVFLAFFIEPVLESNIFHIMLFTWLWGVMKEYSLVESNRICIKR